MKNYVGKKCKGFDFKQAKTSLPKDRKKFLGKIGVITEQNDYNVLIEFKTGEVGYNEEVGMYYPISEVEKHLVDEEKDTIVEAVRDDLQKRSEIGIKKYNTTLDRTDLTEIDWLNHAYEEALDLALYLKKTITLKANERID